MEPAAPLCAGFPWSRPLPAFWPSARPLRGFPLALCLLAVLAFAAHARAAGPERAVRVENPERAVRVENPERAARVENPERAARADNPERAARRQAPAGGELVCPARVGVGEPFVLRLRLPWRAREASVRFLGRSAPLELRAAGAGAEAWAVLGADVLDARPGWTEVAVRVVPANGGTARTFARRVELAPVPRPVERLTLDPAMVTPPEGELPRIATERALSRQALARAGTPRLWSLPLARPLDTEVSSPYGVGRVLNGQPRSPHRGLDLEAQVGDPVRAAADGVVALSGDFYYAGQCVYLDHGQGLATMYLHLSERLVEPGQRVARGQVLGLAGDTGRSTRAHLHFGVAALGRLVDPEPLFLYDGRQ